MMAIEIQIQPHELQGTKVVAQVGDGSLTLKGEILGFDPNRPGFVVQIGDQRVCRAPERLGEVGFSTDFRGKYRLFLQPMSRVAKEALLGFALTDEFHEFEKANEEAKKAQETSI